MPRTTLVFPTSTTRRLDIEDRLPVASTWSRLQPALHRHQVAGADRGDLVSIFQQGAALIVDARPSTADSTIAEDTGNAIARFVDRSRPPFGEHRFPIGRFAE